MSYYFKIIPKYIVDSEFLITKIKKIMSIEDINQEDYFIMIQSDLSIKIGKNPHDLSRPKLKRTTAGLHYGTYTISEFSCIFQKCYESSLTSDVNNVNKSSPFLSYADKNTINDICLPNINNNIPASESLLPIVVDNNSDLDLSMDKEEVEKIKHQLVKPKLTRQYKNVS